MTSVLHPVGPEPSQTYWVRRLVVIASAVLVLAIVVVLIINGTSRGSAVQADPAPPAAAPVPASTPTPTMSSTSMRTPGGSSPSDSGSATSSAEATTTASATPSSTATGKASSKATSKATSTPKPSATKSAKPTGPVACRPSELRPTLTGKPRLKPKQKTTFALSLINGSDQTCTVGLTGKNFELRIYSGKDRIWSTNDCATAVKPVTGKLKSQDAVTWSMSWNGLRSKAGCKQRPEVPRAGTYVATAQLDGAKPVRLRFFLRK